MSKVAPGSFYTRDDCAKEYKLGDTLGTGSFATVKKGECRSDGSTWAIKCIEKAKMQKEDEEALRVEVAILEKVNHPNIVRLRQIFDCPKVFYMVMECMTGGELFDRIVEKSRYSEGEAAETIRKMADALAYCHANGIVHRDLKPENLLYNDSTDGAEIKIADFGLAALLKETDMMATACGTPGYVAPEVLEGKTYNEKVDCWSLGVIAYILLCGFPPFYDENNATLFAQIKAGAYDFPSPYWDDVSPAAKEFIGNLLVVDPAGRLSMAEVLKHPWITGEKSSTILNIGEQLKKYNARRRFRQGVRKVQALQKFAKLGHFSFGAVKSALPSPIEPSEGSHGETPVGGAGALPTPM